MKIILLILALAWSSLSLAVCSNVVRSNYGFGTVLGSTVLNTDFNNILIRINDFPGDCLTDETVTSAKILNGTIATVDIADSAVETAKLANGAVTSAKMAATYTISVSNSSSYITTSTTYEDVTNLAASITTTGKPVIVTVVPDADPSYIEIAKGASGAARAQIKLVRGSTDVKSLYLGEADGAATDIFFPPGAISFIDTPTAGAHNYKIQALVNLNTVSLSIIGAKLFVREL
jgi:predicted small secreted protein